MERQWYYATNGTKFGPVTAGELRILSNEGKLSPSDLVWKEGMADWKPASKIKGLFPTSPSTQQIQSPSLPSQRIAASDSVPLAEVKSILAGTVDVFVVILPSVRNPLNYIACKSISGFGVHQANAGFFEGFWIVIDERLLQNADRLPLISEATMPPFPRCVTRTFLHLLPVESLRDTGVSSPNNDVTSVKSNAFESYLNVCHCSCAIEDQDKCATLKARVQRLRPFEAPFTIVYDVFAISLVPIGVSHTTRKPAPVRDVLH